MPNADDKNFNPAETPQPKGTVMPNADDKTKPGATPEATITISKADFDKMQESLASVAGLADVVKGQNEVIASLKEQVATATSSAANATAAITKGYVQPAKIAGGKWKYTTLKVKVFYKQATVNGVIHEKEMELEITMPEPCGKLNSRMSELKGRIIPRIMKSKGISDYQITDVALQPLNDKEDERTEMKAVGFVGKKISAFTEEDCEEFAIIYEGLQIPVNATLTNMRARVAQEWAYVLHDTPHQRPLIDKKTNKVIDKMTMTVDLVDYKGVRQEIPVLEEMSPSQFRELAEAGAEADAGNK